MCYTTNHTHTALCKFVTLKIFFVNILGVQNKKYFSDLAVEMYKFLESDIQHNELRFEERNGLLPT